MTVVGAAGELWRRDVVAPADTAGGADRLVKASVAGRTGGHDVGGQRRRTREEDAKADILAVGTRSGNNGGLASEKRGSTSVMTEMVADLLQRHQSVRSIRTCCSCLLRMSF